MYENCDHELEVADTENCPLCRIKELEAENESLKVPEIIVGINKLRKRIEELVLSVKSLDGAVISYEEENQKLKTENSVIIEQNETMNKSCVRYEKAIERALKFIGSHQHSTTICKAISILQEASEKK